MSLTHIDVVDCLPLKKVKLAIQSHKWGLMSFLLPLLVRATPEVLVGPYPVGFDPIAFYIPITLDWSSGGTGALTILGTSPLLFLFTVPVYSLTGVNPVWIFKILGPLLYGFMVCALYRFLRFGLAWPERSSLLCALFTSIYFVTLSIGWGLFRTVLGLTFLLLLIPFFTQQKPDDRPIVQALLLILTIVSDQLTGILAVLIVGSLIVWDTTHANLHGAKRLFPQFLIAALTLAIVAYSFFVYPSNYFPLPPLSQTIRGLSSDLVFIPYAFLPLLPFLLLGMRRGTSLEMNLWILICSCLALICALPFAIFRETSYRWTLLIDIPLCIISFGALEKLLSSVRIAGAGLVRHLARISSPSFFIVMAMLYLLLPANIAMPYFTLFPDFVPSSMGQNTVPSYDMNSVVQSLNWIASHSGQGTALITHQAIYGWARAFFPFRSEIVNYQFANPQSGASQALSLGYSRIYAIWWVQGSGWYNYPSMGSGFVPVHVEGDIAVYLYTT